MKKPVLVIMAAGMGSRYGGLKQIDPIGPHGEIIIEYSIFDALRAGFEEVVFVIKEENLELFKEKIGKKLTGYLQVSYAFQKLEDLPNHLMLPAGRIKPWGTAHAVYSARDFISNDFVVINGDDFYGKGAFASIFQYFTKTLPQKRSESENLKKRQYAMVAYELKNTLTSHGYVSRGICQCNSAGELEQIQEVLEIYQDGQDAKYTEDKGKTYQFLAGDTATSMNMWGFEHSFLQVITEGFDDFFAEKVKFEPLKSEYFLPSVVQRDIIREAAKVQVLLSKDRWFGVTYQEDKIGVKKDIRSLIESGLYPEELW